MSPGPQDRAAKVWAALNSNFGMWLCSAVLVSGLGTLYTKYQTSVENERKQRESNAAEAQRIAELRDRLKLEISYRTSQALTLLDQLDRATNAKSNAAANGKQLKTALDPLALAPTASNPPLLPQVTAAGHLRRQALEQARRLRTHLLTATQRALKTLRLPAIAAPLFIISTPALVIRSARPASWARCRRSMRAWPS